MEVPHPPNDSHLDELLFEFTRRGDRAASDTIRLVTEAVAKALRLDRVSVWRLTADGGSLVCEEGYRASTAEHFRETPLVNDVMPSYFAALKSCRVIAADEAETDPRTFELAKDYLSPRGISSMMDVPIWRGGRLYGVLCHEHVGPPRKWTTEEVRFSSNMADLLGESLESAALRAAELKWHTVLSSIAEAVFVLDRTGKIVASNPSAAKLLDLAGGGDTFEDRRRLIEFYDSAGRSIPPGRAAGGRSLAGETIRGEIVYAYFKHSGEQRSFHVSSAPLRIGDQIEGVVVVMGDITEEAYLDRLKSDLLRALSHELETPLTIVKGYAQHLSRSPELADAWKTQLDAIVRASDRMDRVIADLLELSSIVLGRLVLAQEPLDLSQLVDQIAQRAGNRSSLHRVITSIKTPVMIYGDALRLRQTVQRLLENAIRYSPRGGEIRVRLEVDELGALLSIEDQGIGIPQSAQAKVFEGFFRPHAGTPHDAGGLGIGLFLARQIALLHGGELWFKSAEGLGSTFYLRLPLLQPS